MTFGRVVVVVVVVVSKVARIAAIFSKRLPFEILVTPVAREGRGQKLRSPDNWHTRARFLAARDDKSLKPDRKKSVVNCAGKVGRKTDRSCRSARGARLNPRRVQVQSRR